MTVDLVVTARTLLGMLVALLPSYSGNRREFYRTARLVLGAVLGELHAEEQRELGGG